MKNDAPQNDGTASRMRKSLQEARRELADARREAEDARRQAAAALREAKEAREMANASSIDRSSKIASLSQELENERRKRKAAEKTLQDRFMDVVAKTAAASVAVPFIDFKPEMLFSAFAVRNGSGYWQRSLYHDYRDPVVSPGGIVVPVAVVQVEAPVLRVPEKDLEHAIGALAEIFGASRHLKS